MVTDGIMHVIIKQLDCRHYHSITIILWHADDTEVSQKVLQSHIGYIMYK